VQAEQLLRWAGVGAPVALVDLGRGRVVLESLPEGEALESSGAPPGVSSGASPVASPWASGGLSPDLLAAAEDAGGEAGEARQLGERLWACTISGRYTLLAELGDAGAGLEPAALRERLVTACDLLRRMLRDGTGSPSDDPDDSGPPGSSLARWRS
jgi:hypothetical protein